MKSVSMNILSLVVGLVLGLVWSSSQTLQDQPIVDSVTYLPVVESRPESSIVQKLSVTSTAGCEAFSLKLETKAWKIASLHNELNGIKNELAREHLERDWLLGQASFVPAELKELFQPDRIADEFHLAFAASGADGGISSVDCSEYPCIAHGEIGSADQLNAVASNSKMVTYQQFIGSTEVWTAGGKTFFSIALSDRSTLGGQTEQLSRRMDHRLREIRMSASESIAF